MAQTTIFDRQLDRFFERLEPAQCLLLTPNKRLSRFLLERYAQYRRSGAVGQGTAFPSLQCLAYSGWLQQQWQHLLLAGDTDRRLLNSVEELLLWEEVIADHPETPPLLNVPATARMARDAWRLLCEWPLLEEQHVNPALGLWCELFKSYCGQRRLITGGEVHACVASALQAGHLSVPAQVWLYGFDEHAPAVSDLLSVMQAGGSEVATLKLETPVPCLTRYELHSDELELEAAAQWALQQVERDPGQRLGIVVPDLGAVRAKAEQVFTRVFDAAYIFPDAPQHAPGFNLSAGQSLAQVPPVAASLAVLQWNLDSLDIEAVSRLLRSPFIGCAAELQKRAQLDIVLREEGEFEVSLQQLKTVVSEFQVADDNFLCPDFYMRLQQFEHWRKQLRAKNSAYPSEWAPLWVAELAAIGWPGDRPLDSLEYQQVQVWQETLEEFSTLDQVLGALPLTRALSVFNKQLQERRFQPQTRTSPVQILGLLEAAGLPFDALWMLHLDDESWPPQPNPNPLLSLAAQVQFQLPQCSSERELAYAQRLMTRLQHSTPVMIFSSARMRDDKPLKCSQLVLAECPQLTDFNARLDVVQQLQKQLYASRVIESSFDHCGPRVLHPEAIRGGSQILKSQAACPFQAFARFRLHSKEIPTLNTGLSPAERGNLVHAVMEIVWRKLRTQEKLLALSDQQLDDLIDFAVARALDEVRNKRCAGARFVELETTRLHSMVRAWLELEKQRAPFQVLFNEGRKTVRLGNMPIHVRYDRVDQLADGRLLVLDYKTGKPEVRDWSGARPNEPQVPLYAVANLQRVAGAAFGQINAEDVSFKGIADQQDIAPGLAVPDMLGRMDLPDDWQAILNHWRSVLERLAGEFLAGDAAVDPKHPSVTCRYCELQSLCRIRERFDSDRDADESGGINDDGAPGGAML